ncbi:MAG: hypothetical protein ACAH21_08440, partial [Ramlibacter sp.]
VELPDARGQAPESAIVLHVATSDPASSEHDLAHIHALQGRLRLDAATGPQAFTFAELAQRIESESAVGYAPLLAALRAR